MKQVFEIIGTFISSLFFMSIPILCTLSFVYKWYPGIIFILIVACLVEWVGLISLLVKVADKQD